MGMEQHPSALGPDEVQPVLMTPAQTGEYLGVTLNTLQKWRSRNIGPKYFKYGGANQSAIRYDKDDVIAFRKAHKIFTREDVDENLLGGTTPATDRD